MEERSLYASIAIGGGIEIHAIIGIKNGVIFPERVVFSIKKYYFIKSRKYENEYRNYNC